MAKRILVKYPQSNPVTSITAADVPPVGETITQIPEKEDTKTPDTPEWSATQPS